ncbi:MBL fold metallo-hydrolase [Agromyces salentinus]|uniref:MBL fold metallo-hydrolase n=1 Tax=Agromyces salentinus TaxID=269421 RepID=UPI0012FA9A7A|nr:MBL fold metallo-hydrolase [Agromyces salentinus]
MSDRLRRHLRVPTPPAIVSQLATCVLAPNPGPMTLDGTNSYVLRAPDAAGVVVVDPGPADEEHLARLAGFGPVELVLLTHHHGDHRDGLVRFAELASAPVRAVDPSYCIGGEPLRDGERIQAAGVSIDVLRTPGHTADSACFSLPEDEPGGSVLTGDTILGRGTTIIADPDGALGPYLDSLERLRTLGRSTGGHVAALPGHGPVLRDLGDICDEYLAHRAERLDQVRAVLAELGTDPADPATVGRVVDTVYAGTDAAVRPAAEASVRAQLAYLLERG